MTLLQDGSTQKNHSLMYQVTTTDDRVFEKVKIVLRSSQLIDEEEVLSDFAFSLDEFRVY